MPQLDHSLLTAALAGYQQQLAEIDAKIADIRRRLGGRNQSPLVRRDGGGGGDIPTPFGRKRRKVSSAARRRIAAAQKKRWAAYRKSKGKAA
jgi:hypothetical protein